MDRFVRSMKPVGFCSAMHEACTDLTKRLVCLYLLISDGRRWLFDTRLMR